MVTHASALGRNGVHDWLLLRAAALIITLYTLYLSLFCALSGPLDYDQWRAFFTLTTTRIFTALTLLALLIHGWIGLWQVLTDYVKPTIVRLIFQLLIVVVLLIYMVCGVAIVWGT